MVDSLGSASGDISFVMCMPVHKGNLPRILSCKSSHPQKWAQNYLGPCSWQTSAHKLFSLSQSSSKKEEKGFKSSGLECNQVESRSQVWFSKCAGHTTSGKQFLHPSTIHILFSLPSGIAGVPGLPRGVNRYRLNPETKGGGRNHLSLIHKHSVFSIELCQHK